MLELAETICAICGLSILGSITIVILLMAIAFIKDFINDEI